MKSLALIKYNCLFEAAFSFILEILPLARFLADSATNQDNNVQAPDGLIAHIHELWRIYLRNREIGITPKRL